ARRQGSRGCR
ncbi:hypothetical protein BN1708_019990, partial [Verticillium longisporum]